MAGNPKVLRWTPFIRAAAQKYKVPPPIIAAVIEHESGGQEGLTSSAGAKGLTQFMPGTARSYGVNTAPGHARSQIFGAAHYLADLGVRRDPAKALASYAAGPGNIPAGLPYASAVLSIAKRYGNLASGEANVPAPAKAPTAPAQGSTGLAKQERLAAFSAYAANPRMPGASTDLALSLLAAQRASPSQPAARTATPMGPAPSTSTVKTLFERAAAINQAHLPYQWGGGHGGKVNPNKPVPLDCSGAVSAVLGINPLVSGQLAKWGKPGPGKTVTIYANGTHTFMEINGHFWGTSSTNPGGGAGWIPRSAISPAYLQGFTARHPAGM